MNARPTGPESRAAVHASPEPADEATTHTRSRYEMAAPVYDLLEWPLEKWRFRTWREHLWAAVEGPEVLELGVGTGKNIPFYPESVSVTAVDLSPNMLERARKRAQSFSRPRLRLLEMDAQALDFPANTFDAVVATFVFCSVPDPVRGLREALRVCRPGGRLHLLEHMRATPPILARLMDAVDAPVHWLTGVHIARQTVGNVGRTGWALETVDSLSTGDIFRRIVAVKTGSDPTP